MCLLPSQKSGTSLNDSLSSVSSESFVHATSFKQQNASVEPKFLIVGAGAAGIACAVSLLRKGFKCVTIIEAENRIGGRIYTKSFSHNIVEMGAQWCHGEKENIVFQMVSGKNMLRSSSYIYTNFDCIRSDGEMVSSDIVQNLKTILAQIFARRDQELPTFEGTLGEYLSKNFFKILNNDEYRNINPVIAREFFENFIKIERSETSAGLDEISGQGFQKYATCDGDYLLHFEDGFLQFLRTLMKADELGNDFGVLEDKILFGIRVKEINWKRSDFKVEVYCENTSAVFLVDHVIVTVSLGVLKNRVHHLFTPELPASKLNAIDGLGFGSIMKIYLEFPAPFWNSQWTGFAMLWREQDLAEIRGSQRAWLEDIYGFYRVPRQPCTLVGWLVGSHIPLVETMSDFDVINGCLYLLRRFLPHWTISQTVDFARSTWDTNPNFRGAFSFRSLKTEELSTSPAELAQPITMLGPAPMYRVSTPLKGALAVKPVVQFAGEATHDCFFGTVHGAVESGIREAQRLEGYYSVDI
ncbi:spermine oxidase [Zeugodacus cucurbitae]|uniref:Spermine oxidase n=1 Tax=Zeugodacus cucurbitae TaxID=28588 RepID=A0A0A1WUA4_ZEUCU|nr:spermine oxidase [Zeugodacus cucurbitae]XP_054089986.1 spermine oxidase [Zeugodacus cucurbitae]